MTPGKRNVIWNDKNIKPTFKTKPELTNFFSCPTQLSMKFVLLTYLKLFTAAKSFWLNIAGHDIFPANKYENAKNATYCWHFHIYYQRKFHAQLSCAWKKFYNLEAKCLHPPFYTFVRLWLTAELEKRIQSLEMRCYRKLQTISCQNRIINEEVRKQIRGAIGFHNELPWSTKEKSDDAATSHVHLIWKRQVFNAQLKG